MPSIETCFCIEVEIQSIAEVGVMDIVEARMANSATEMISQCTHSHLQKEEIAEMMEIWLYIPNGRCFKFSCGPACTIAALKASTQSQLGIPSCKQFVLTDDGTRLNDTDTVKEIPIPSRRVRAKDNKQEEAEDQAEPREALPSLIQMHVCDEKTPTSKTLYEPELRRILYVVNTENCNVVPDHQALAQHLCLPPLSQLTTIIIEKIKDVKRQHRREYPRHLASTGTNEVRELLSLELNSLEPAHQCNELYKLAECSIKNALEACASSTVQLHATEAARQYLRRRIFATLQRLSALEQMQQSAQQQFNSDKRAFDNGLKKLANMQAHPRVVNKIANGPADCKLLFCIDERELRKPIDERKQELAKQQEKISIMIASLNRLNDKYGDLSDDSKASGVSLQHDPSVQFSSLRAHDAPNTNMTNPDNVFYAFDSEFSKILIGLGNIRDMVFARAHRVTDTLNSYEQSIKQEFGWAHQRLAHERDELTSTLDDTRHNLMNTFSMHLALLNRLLEEADDTRLFVSKHYTDTMTAIIHAAIDLRANDKSIAALETRQQRLSTPLQEMALPADFGSAYDACIAEIQRRHAFDRRLSLTAQCFNQYIDKRRGDEKKARIDFVACFRDKVPRSFLPPLFDTTVPRFSFHIIGASGKLPILDDNPNDGHETPIDVEAIVDAMDGMPSTGSTLRSVAASSCKDVDSFGKVELVSLGSQHGTSLPAKSIDEGSNIPSRTSKIQNTVPNFGDEIFNKREVQLQKQIRELQQELTAAREVYKLAAENLQKQSQLHDENTDLRKQLELLALQFESEKQEHHRLLADSVKLRSFEAQERILVHYDSDSQQWFALSSSSSTLPILFDDMSIKALNDRRKSANNMTFVFIAAVKISNIAVRSATDRNEHGFKANTRYSIVEIEPGSILVMNKIALKNSVGSDAHVAIPSTSRTTSQSAISANRQELQLPQLTINAIP